MKNLLPLILTLCLSSPALAVEISAEAPPAPIRDNMVDIELEDKPAEVEPASTTVKGLVKVDVLKREHRWQLRAPRQYTYELENGNKVLYSHKLRKTKDLRPYEVQHPHWVKLQQGAEHWGPVAGFASNFIVPTALLLSRYFVPNVKVTR